MAGVVYEQKKKKKMSRRVKYFLIIEASQWCVLGPPSAPFAPLRGRGVRVK